MTTDADAIFTAALALPQPLRADLADRLIESLEDSPSEPIHISDECMAVIMARSDALHRGEATLVDGQEVADWLQGIIDQAGGAS
jgi:hypothetical protein